METGCRGGGQEPAGPDFAPSPRRHVPGYRLSLQRAVRRDCAPRVSPLSGSRARRTCKVKQSPAARKKSLLLLAAAVNWKNAIFLACSTLEPLNAQRWAPCPAPAGFLSLPHVRPPPGVSSPPTQPLGCTQAPGALPLHYLLATLLVRPRNKWLREPLVSPAARLRPVLGQAAGSAESLALRLRFPRALSEAPAVGQGLIHSNFLRSSQLSALRISVC